MPDEHTERDLRRRILAAFELTEDDLANSDYLRVSAEAREEREGLVKTMRDLAEEISARLTAELTSSDGRVEWDERPSLKDWM